MAGCVVAIDVGGTFTDIALADLEAGQLWTTKTPTTPHDQSQGFATGVAKVLQQAGKTPGDVELVNLRVSARGPAWSFALQPLPVAPATSMPLPATRVVYFPTSGFVECPVYDYTSLPPGAFLTGPAIITQDLSTIVVQPQHQVRLDSYGNIIMTIPPHTA